VAALIERETGVVADLMEGRRGEFSVSVGGEIVARKDSGGFPAEEAVLAAVKQSLG
jgi:predicted Rdx family selenoprotein